MTLADFLSSGNLKDLLHHMPISDANIPQLILNALIPVKLLSEEKKMFVLKTFNLDEKNLAKLSTIQRMYAVPSNDLGTGSLAFMDEKTSYEIMPIRATTQFSAVIGLAYYKGILDIELPNFYESLKLWTIIIKYLSSKTTLLLAYEESTLKFSGNALLVIGEYLNILGQKFSEFTLVVTNLSEDGFVFNAVGSVIVITVSFYFLKQILSYLGEGFLNQMRLTKQRDDQKSQILIKSSGLKTPIVELQNLLGDIKKFEFELSRYKKAKQAQAQKINEKITNLRHDYLLDDEVLITMVDEYLTDLPGAQEKINLFETIKTQHRTTVEQDTLYHNKTHLNLISNFFNTLEVNDLF